jgi:phospholipase C
MPVDRRTFVKGALGASGAVLLGGVGGGSAGASPGRSGRDAVLDSYRAVDVALPNPASSGIEHVVVVMMENRSFDHFLGWLPHADGRQSGLSYADPSGKVHKTFHQTQFNGCGFTDPDHSYGGGRLQYNGGKMNGFLTDTANEPFAISYFEAKDRPFMSKLAQAYTTCDRYFCSFLGPTYPNRFFQHSAQTDRLDDALTRATMPTIWDQLNQPGGPTGHYYYSDVPFIALYGGTYTSISSNFTQFLSDAAAGTLPNVSYVEPRLTDEATGTSSDDHPLADIRAGDAFLSDVFHAVASGPGWGKTVLVINYDEWGGFFDHVPPRRITPGIVAGAAPTSGVDKDVDANGKVLSGFRVPCIIASPFSRIGGVQPAVSHNFYDHTSVLKLIEWRWGLKPMTQRDASHAATDPGNLATALNFKRPVPKVAKLPVLAAFTPTACAASTTPSTEPAGIAPADDTGPTGIRLAGATTATATDDGENNWTRLAASPLMDDWN